MNMKVDLIHLVKYQRKDHGPHHHQKTQILEIVHTMINMVNFNCFCMLTFFNMNKSVLFIA